MNNLMTKSFIARAMLSVTALAMVGCGTPPDNSGSSSSTTSSSVGSISSTSSSSSSSSSQPANQGELVVAINAGGQSGTFGGVEFQRDQFADGGSTSTTEDAISGTTDDALYQSERYGSFVYDIPVTAGTFSLKLHFAEIYQESAGERSFHVSVEGSQELSDLDIYSVAGHDGAYIHEVDNVAVSDGSLTIEFEGVVDNATISGIEVYSPDGELDSTDPGPGNPGNGNPDLPNTGPARSMGYLGCSMSVNVAEGYEMLGGERLWSPIGQYNGQVVQNWADSNDPVWGAFENAMNQYGTPQDVWVMLCIFSNQVTIEETRQIIANVRQRVPDANIYITGQPLYDDPNSCFLAGNGGPDKTDRIAQEAGNEAGLNVTYPGSLGPLAANQNSDGCHANDNGRRELGQQFIDWFGQ